MDYRSAGVDIDKADNLIDDVKKYAKATYIPGVLGGVGGFGAMFELGKYKNPVMISSTDGIGTKILLAQETGYYSGMGDDLVAMCVDDVVCCGGKPLFFLDYIAVGKLNEEVYLTLIKSVSEACRFAECALIGGETAELPGMYKSEDFDLAGFSVGVVEKKMILDPKNVKEGDIVIGLESSGFHSNGYSLVRKIVKDKKLDLKKDYGFGELGKSLLSPTRIYSPVLVKAIEIFKKSIKGIAHITGGGIEGNLCRVIPENMDAVINKKSWPVPPVIKFLCDRGEVSDSECYKVFNMGIGMAVVCDAKKAVLIMNWLKENDYASFVIGSITKGKGEVRFS